MDLWIQQFDCILLVWADDDLEGQYSVSECEKDGPSLTPCQIMAYQGWIGNFYIANKSLYNQLSVGGLALSMLTVLSNILTHFPGIVTGFSLEIANWES